MPKYRKKPVVIEAFQVVLNTTDRNSTVHAPTLDWLMGIGVADTLAAGFNFAPDRIEIGTLEGVMRAEIGDWIIRGVQGEFYPCKADIFEATYEPVTDKEEGE